MLLLQMHRTGDLLGEREDQCDDMFRDHRPVHFTGIGEHDIAVHELWKHELMHRGGGRMDPAQLLSGLELFGTERPGDDYLGIANLLFDGFIAGEMNNFNIRKFFVQPLRNPDRSVPELETMVQHYKELHAKNIL